jgi:2-polyprenyl-6-methoxyphenol hydroxylase-like FAD-dependent oxidoreductase
MNAAKPKAIAIVGAGIAGPSAALALARDGHHVTVFDQRPASALMSTGILGMRRGNCRSLEALGTDLSSRLPGRIYHDLSYGADRASRTPFVLFAWTDLHNAIVHAAMEAGVTFRFDTPVQSGWHPELDGGYRHDSADVTIDAGGLASAARRLHGEYIGQLIYRGISPVHTRHAFSTFKLPEMQVFCDIGNTRQGTAFAFGVHRPQWENLATSYTSEVPPETDYLPAEFQRIVRACNPIQVLPQSVWSPPGTIHNDAWDHFTLGDANGPVRPLTTSGANLAVQAGMAAPGLVNNHDEMLAAQILEERAYALKIGEPGMLNGPQIGGYLEDPDFFVHQHGLYMDGTL